MYFGRIIAGYSYVQKNSRSMKNPISRPFRLPGWSGNAFSLIALLVSVYFAASFLEGERLRTRELKDALQEVESAHEETLRTLEVMRMQTIQADNQLVEKIDAMYGELGALNEKERLQRLRLIQRNKQINETQTGNTQNRAKIREASGFKFRTPGQ